MVHVPYKASSTSFTGLHYYYLMLKPVRVSSMNNITNVTAIYDFNISKPMWHLEWSKGRKSCKYCTAFCTFGVILNVCCLHSSVIFHVCHNYIVCYATVLFHWPLFENTLLEDHPFNLKGEGLWDFFSE